MNHNPLLIIAPVKEEQLFDDPPIYLYHDVITETQAKLIKNLTSNKV
jgi:hypothetical protein